MSDDARAQLDPVLRRARFGKRDDGDRFVGLWLALVVAARQQRLTPSLAGARRTIEDFFRGREVQAAVEVAGPDALQEQLRDAAAIYFQSCITDPNYSSVIWGMNRLQPDQLRAKAAKDAAATLAAIVESRAAGPAEALPGLLVLGFVDVFGEPGRAALRVAAARHHSLASLAI